MGEEYDPAEATASSEDEGEKEAKAKRQEEEEEPAIGPAFVRAEEAAALRELETTALSSSLPSSSSAAVAVASTVQKEEEEATAEATTMIAKKRQRKTTKARQRKRQRQKEVGEQVESATDVYATGIPADAGDAELAAFFGKAGVVRRDAGSGRPRIRVYRDGDGRPKGDATVSYLRRESVGLALTLLDGAELRPGCAVSVTRAVYQVKGARIPSSSSSLSSSSQAQEDKKHLLTRQAQAQLSWAADEGPAHVVLRGMFTQEEVAAASAASASSSSSGGVEDFVGELKADIAAEAGRHGRVLSVAVFEHNPEGVAVVKVDGAAAAERCIAAMDGRFFAGRRIRAELYDGVSDFRVAESDEQRDQRIRAWQQWLDTQQQRDAEGDDNDDGDGDGDEAANR